MRHAIIAVLLLAALAGTAVAGPFEDAVSARERGDYATALREFRVLAEQGVARAQNNLGLMYNSGTPPWPSRTMMPSAYWASALPCSANTRNSRSAVA